MSKLNESVGSIFYSSSLFHIQIPFVRNLKIGFSGRPIRKSIHEAVPVSQLHSPRKLGKGRGGKNNLEGVKRERGGKGRSSYHVAIFCPNNTITRHRIIT